MNPISASIRLLLLLALTATLGLADAQAQRGGSSRKDVQANEYPNAKREEPRTKAENERIVTSLRKADEHFFDEQYDRAKAELMEVVESTRANEYEKAFAYIRLGDIAYEQDDVTAALDYKQKAYDLDSLDNNTHFSNLYAIAQIAINEEDYERSLATVDLWLEQTGSETADAWALKGNALYRLDRFGEAGGAMRRAFQLKPEGKTGWAELMLAAYAEAEQYDQAIAAGEEVLARDPDNTDVALRLVEAYNEAGQKDKALTMLSGMRERGNLTKPNDYLYLADAYDSAERFLEAADVLNDGLAKGVLEPGRDVYLRLGNAYTDAEQPAKAAEAYCKGADLSTNDGTLDYQCAYMLIQDLERFADGKKHAEAALAKGGLRQEGEALVLLGDAEAELGNPAAAKQAYTKALAFSSAKVLAESRLRNLQR